MAKTSVAPKRARTQILLPPRVKRDPAYIGLRLKGLASLVDAAADSQGHMERLDTPALLFISTELEEMAEQRSRA